LNQVSVNSDRRGGSGAGRGDHLGAWIDHVAGGPDTDGAGAAGVIDSDEASLIDLATQTGQQTIGMGQVSGPDEHGRPRDVPTLEESADPKPTVATVMAAYRADHSPPPPDDWPLVQVLV
jgi:hypothetical protein